jgi:hypothetical protein
MSRLLPFWSLLYCLLSAYSAELSVPASFGSLQVGQPSVDRLLEVLSQYTLQTHMEIVLVGKSFSSWSVSQLESRLEQLSRVSAHSSPFPHVHEKLVYHVTLGQTLTEPLQALVSGKDKDEGESAVIVDYNKVGKVLASYHERAATTTSLFIFNASSDASPRYSYSPPSALPSCPQRAFLARDAAFAWLDLSAEAPFVKPATDGRGLMSSLSSLSSSSSSSSSSLGRGGADALASAVHAAGVVAAAVACAVA